MVGAAIADVLGLGELPGRSPRDVLAKLGSADALLVLDNCEHLLDGVAGLVERLLAACPRVVVLATSRSRLRVPFEYVFPVPGMSLEGGSGSEGDAGDATALFRERASMTGWRSPYADDLRGSRASVVGSTGWRSRSSWPPPGWRPSASTAWTGAWPIHWGC